MAASAEKRVGHLRMASAATSLLLAAMAMAYVALHHLHARCGEEQQLHVDAAGVHVSDTAFVDALNLFQEHARALGLARAVEAPQAVESRIVELASCDDAHDLLDQLGRRPGFLGRYTLVSRRLVYG